MAENLWRMVIWNQRKIMLLTIVLEGMERWGEYQQAGNFFIVGSILWIHGPRLRQSVEDDEEELERCVTSKRGREIKTQPVVTDINQCSAHLISLYQHLSFMVFMWWILKPVIIFTFVHVSFHESNQNTLL